MDEVHGRRRSQRTELKDVFCLLLAMGGPDDDVAAEAEQLLKSIPANEAEQLLAELSQREPQTAVDVPLYNAAAFAMIEQVWPSND